MQCRSQRAILHSYIAVVRRVRKEVTFLAACRGAGIGRHGLQSDLMTRIVPVPAVAIYLWDRAGVIRPGPQFGFYITAIVSRLLRRLRVVVDLPSWRRVAAGRAGEGRLGVSNHRASITEVLDHGDIGATLYILLRQVLKGNHK